MKKFLTIPLIILLFLVGIFFYKGGHHALALSGKLEDWLDAENAAQQLTVEYQNPAHTTGHHWYLTAESFWTEYNDERVFGLTSEGVTVYLCGRSLYLETGKAYVMPESLPLEQSMLRLSLGFLLHGRVHKNGDTYHITMKTGELDFSAAVTADSRVRAMAINATLPNKTSVHATLTPQQPLPHNIPQKVADAMIRAQTQPPMSLSEPLAVLLPAAQRLLPLTGELKLGLSCGILEVSEAVQLTICDDRAVLVRNGNQVDLKLPGDFSDLSPMAMALLLLRDGEMTRTENGAIFTVNLTADASTGILQSVVSQAADLGITLGDSVLLFKITDDRLSSISITSEGSVPFLFTTIPVYFSAELTIT